MNIEGKTVAVTGVGGFIGGRVAARLASMGARVRGVDLDPDAVSRASRAGVEAEQGDITSKACMARLVEGADLVVHTAACVREGGRYALFDRINVGGTRCVADACRAARVAQLVHLSSVMVYGFDYPDGVTEEGPYPALEGNPYVLTKLRSEGAAMTAHHGPTGVTIIRPGDVYGPGSVPWVERPLGLMRQGLFVLPDGGRALLNHVHVENLVDAIVLAVERDVTGVPINVTDGARTTTKTFFTHLAQTAGLPAPRTLPSAVLDRAFAVLEGACRVARIEPPAQRSALDFLRRPGLYSIERARTRLGYVPRIDLETGMRELAGA
ncbi:MAG: NAD-dependent epimerase/dehydratase family protein [Sandaracinaceae bacterium]